MSNFQAVNNRIACKPFESLAIETQGSTFKTVKQKTSLLPLEVLWGNYNLEYRPGDTIYVRGDVTTLPWTREVFEVDGMKFILVPAECIQMRFIP